MGNDGQKKDEAVLRMKILGIYPTTREQFEESGIVSISEPPKGALFWTTDEDMQHIWKFEQEQNALVYLVIRSFTKYGTLDSYLFVKGNEGDWKEEREALQEGVTLAYVYNQQDPVFSEMGFIRFRRTVAEGFLRLI